MSETIKLPVGPESPKQELVVQRFQEGVQVILIGGAMGSGKSFLLQMLTALRVGNPKTRIAMSRRTLSELEGPGGLVDICSGIYEKLTDFFVFKKGRSNNYPCFKFLNGVGGSVGATITFMPMNHEDAAEKWRGLQAAFIGVDEAHLYSENQINMMISRLRSETEFPGQLLMTCNPDPDWYWCDQIKDYYLDEDGSPIQEKAGDVRYFFRKNGEYIWAESKKELIDKYDLIDYLANQGVVDAENEAEKMIKSFTFIPMNVYDNPPLLRMNPDYLSSLLQMSEIEKKRNLWGNWFARPEGSGVFKREWLRGEDGERVKRLSDVPHGCIAMRGVDKAYAIPSEGQDPDFTAIAPLFLKDREGFVWILGNYHPKMIDEKPYKKGEKLYLGQFRKLAGERDTLIALQMETDIINAESYKYQTPKLVLAKESAGAAADFYSTIALMAEKGIQVEKDQTIGNIAGKKMQDFLPFTKDCELGKVFIVEESFEPESLKFWYKTLEEFEGKKSTRTKKDDHVDAVSITYNAISKAKRPYRPPVIGTKTVDTLSANYLRKMS